MVRTGSEGALRSAVTACVMVGLLCLSAPSEAQELMLQPAAELEPLARRAARALRMRGVDARVGEPAPAIPEAVGPGHVALVSRGGAVWVGLGGPTGATHSDSLALDRADPGAAQAIALAIQDLHDEVRGTPDTPRSSDGAGADWVYLEYPREEPTRQGVLPTIYLRVLAGYSPTRNRVLVGPGAGFGLCVGAHCLVIEADLPLVPEVVQLETGERLRYRAVNTSIRAQLRPLVRNDWSLGLTIGLLSRIGSVSMIGGDYRRSVSNLGFRSSIELAWRIAGPLEWVMEVGVDAVHRSSRARALVYGQSVFLEDAWTPWLVSSLRIRPQVGNDD